MVSVSVCTQKIGAHSTTRISLNLPANLPYLGPQVIVSVCTQKIGAQYSILAQSALQILQVGTCMHVPPARPPPACPPARTSAYLPTCSDPLAMQWMDGTGSFGTVTLGRRTSDNQLVAIKKIQDEGQVHQEDPPPRVLDRILLPEYPLTYLPTYLTFVRRPCAASWSWRRGT